MHFLFIASHMRSELCVLRRAESAFFIQLATHIRHRSEMSETIEDRMLWPWRKRREEILHHTRGGLVNKVLWRWMLMRHIKMGTWRWASQQEPATMKCLWMWRGPLEARSTQEAKLLGVYLTSLLVKFRNLMTVIINRDNMVIIDFLRMQSKCSHWRLTPLFDKIMCNGAEF